MYTVLMPILWLTIPLSSATVLEEYERNRTRILEQESRLSLGGTLRLTDAETKANQILMQLKEDEHKVFFQNSEKFNFSRHYFTYKEFIEKSKVYQIIRSMPKGAVLHTHATFMLDAEFLLNMTYEHQDYLYACYTDHDVRFNFALSVPLAHCDAKWALVETLRANSDDVYEFDTELKKHFTLLSDENNTVLDLDGVWKKFNHVHLVTKSLIAFRPVREKFIYESLKRCYDDNVMYVEMRSGLHTLYELDGTKHDALYLIKLHRDVTKRFIEDHPDFIGMKLIITKHRAASFEAVKSTIDNAIKIKREYPDMFAGFDLVGQEDKGKSLEEFLPLLLPAKKDLNFYFHAGETDWFGTVSDENLIDAILLGTKRIGHGFALSKHPVLLNIVKERGIAVEVNVVSNAVLDLVSDVRDHPLASYLSQNVPVVLSSDDPGVWDAEPLSHDFYIAFMAVASKRSDLRLLKQLAINSIRYSALENRRKVKFLQVFDKRWKQFVNNLMEKYDSS